MTHKVTFLPGDGIGPEVSNAARKCIDATGVKIDWEEITVGEKAVEKFATPLPKEALDSIKKNRVALKGPITTPIAGGFRSVNVALRQELNLYACLRPCKNYKGLAPNSKYNDIDINITVVRENTEDLYAGIEFEKGKDATLKLIEEIDRVSKRKIQDSQHAGISIKPISEFASQRIVRFAFEYAKNNHRKKVTAVHKANIMKFSDGIFLETARKVAKDYAGKIEFEEGIVDQLCMQLVLRPQNYDVLVLPNLYGDIVSDLCAGLIGGLGVAPGANIGDEIAVFEPTHGSAPKYTGQDKTNPAATILSGVLMLKYLKEFKAAEKLEKAVIEVIKEGKFVTYDLKRDRDDPSAVGTSEMAEAICRKLA